MKISIFWMSIFMSTLTFIIHAQDLKINIKSGAEKLGYSYVYINNKILTTADSLGVVVLPKKELNIGDTVKVSFLGFTENKVVYNEEISALNQLDIELDAAIEVSDVVVKGDILKFYKKVVDQRQFISNFYEQKFDFSVVHIINNDTLKYAIGDARLADNVYRRRYKYHRLKISGDTISNIKGILQKTVHKFLYPPRGMKAKDIKNDLMIDDSTYSIKYIGIEDDCNVFSSSGEYFNGRYFTLFYFDRRSKWIKRIEAQYISSMSDGEKIIESSSVNYGRESMITMLNGTFRVESSDKNKGVIEVKLWNIDNTRDIKPTVFEDGEILVDVFPKMFPYFEFTKDSR